ncbi:MAG: TonB-dependent receptor plug domain-containing protein [Desulfatibacillaceae bacterium]
MRIILTCIALLVFGVTGALAEDTEEASGTMHKMQVTSTRTQKQADLAPAKVEVITREDMEMMQVNTIDDALKYQTGLYLDRPAGLGDALPATTMRGMPGDERSLVMVDGIPVNDPYSSLVPYNMIDPNAISQVEVVLGPNSALYGGNAVGGTINMITADPTELEVGGRLGIGTYNNRKAGGWVGDKLGDRFTFRLTFDWEAQDGYPTSLATETISNGAATGITGGYEIPYDVDPDTGEIEKRWVVGDMGNKNSERFGGTARFTLKPSDTSKLTFLFMGGHHAYDYEEPNSYITDGNGPVNQGKVTVGNGKVSGTVNPKDFLLGQGKREYYAPALTWQQMFGDVGLTAKLAWQLRESMYTSDTGPGSGNYFNCPGYVVESTDDEYMAEVQADVPFTLGRRHMFTGGLFYKLGAFDQETTALTFFRDEDSKTGPVYDITRGDTSFFAPFAQVEWSLHDRVTLYTGLRVDWWWAENGKSGDPNDLAVLEDRSKSAWSPKLSAVWEPVKDATYIRASVAQAFKPPTIYDLYRTWTSGWGTLYKSNPDLDPETLWNYELGVDQYFWARRVKFGATVFYSQLKDAIGSFKEPSGAYVKKNVSDLDVLGFETGLRVYPFDWMQSYVNYARYESEIQEDRTDPDLEGKSLENFPRDTVKLGADFRLWKFRYGIFGTYYGKTHWNAENAWSDEDVYSGFAPHWSWDTKLTFKATEHVEASVAWNNMFDEPEYWGGSIPAGTTVYGEIRFDM